MVQLEGYIEYIRYHNENNGYTVLELETTHGDEILVGTFRYIHEGEYITVTAEPVDHPIHGPQYQVLSYQVKPPEDKKAMERYLSSGAVKGVGPKLAEKIIKTFKGDTFHIIETEPERLAEIKGISIKKAMDIAVQFQEKQDMRNAMMFMAEYGVSDNYAVRIYEAYGEDMYDVVRTNPYRLAEDIRGIGFKIADNIAARVGISPDSDQRVRAAILYTLSLGIGSGHVYLPKQILCRNTAALINVSPDFVEEHIMDMVLDGKIMIREIGEEQRIYSSMFYFMELNVAQRLKELDVSFVTADEDIEACIGKLEESSEIKLDANQRDAVYKAVREGLLVVTGGPGTGKTTTINLMIKCFEMMDLTIMLAAPTGRAAKRMTEATGHEAKTIHRLLELNGGMEDGEDYHFEKNESSPLEADVVIIDEVSMVDISLMNALLKALIPGTRLILVGDANQLPSVGPGNVLRDIIDCGRFSVVRLTRIYRQEEDSRIVLNAHKINRGEQLSLNQRSKDFFFYEKDDYKGIISGLIYLIRTGLPDYLKVDPFEIQVLTAMRKGDLGVEHLNQVLQYYLNPADSAKLEREGKNGVFREGDKVMQIRNNYKLEWKIKNHKGFTMEEGMGIFNGDLGVIRQINTFSERVTVVFDEEKEVEYPFSSLDELELAYAITIHKSQGSEYPAVIIPLLSGPPILCNRNLLYTAVTRARKCVSVIGRSAMVEQMIDNETEQKRYSGLKECLEEAYETFKD